MFEYYACSGCHREFFSKDAFMAHPCMANGSNTTGRLANMATCEKAPAFDTKPGITKAPVTRVSSSADSEATVSVDKSLDDCKELVDMKTELVANGVQCQTMNEAQTKAAYAKLKAEQEAKVSDAQNEDVPPPPTTARRARSRKTDADKNEETR